MAVGPYNPRVVDHWIFDLWVGMLGAVVGSYLNVVAYRLPRGISTTLPRSRCPTCLAPIRPWHNVPVLGWVLLLGRCRHCRRPVSFRYPAVEAFTGVLFVFVFRRFDRPVDMLVGAGFAAAMVALALIDFDVYLLPDAITLPGLVLGLAMQPWLHWASMRDALIGAAAGGGALWLVGRVWWLARGVEGMGFGDVKMLAMVGAFLGWQGALMTLIVASFLGTIVGGTLLLARRVRFGSRLPFGVFLAIGALTTLLWAQDLAHLYLRTVLRWRWPSVLVESLPDWLF